MLKSSWWGEAARLSGFSGSWSRITHCLATVGCVDCTAWPQKHTSPPFFFYSGSCLCSPLQGAGLRLPGGASAASEPRISAAPVTWQTTPRRPNFNFSCDMWRMEVRGGHARSVRSALIRRGGGFCSLSLRSFPDEEKRDNRSPFTRRGARRCHVACEFKRLTKHYHEKINFKVNGSGVKASWGNIGDPPPSPTSVNKVRAPIGKPRLRTGCQRSSLAKLARFS